MSVMFSQIDISPQDDVETEMQNEDLKQQQELKAFLEEELDDGDLFDNASFTSTGRFSDPQYTKTAHSKQNSGRHSNSGDISFHQNSIHNDYGDNEDFGDHLGMHNGYPYNGYQDGNHNNIDHYPAAAHPSISNDPYPNTQHVTQLQTLYEARGRKIESLQREVEEKDESYAKEMRILNHKLILATGDKEGAMTSMKQLQDLLHEHKTDLHKNQQALEEEMQNNRVLTNQIDELNEKLLASDETINSLQQQIQMMNQSDSLARARAQHESLLATMRQKHEAEILSLKEKLDDMKQSLAWKTEDNNRYREMLDSNSAASEMGILQNRLRAEEDTTKNLRNELEKKTEEIQDLETQLDVYESLVKKNQNQFASTPFVPSNGKGIRRGLLDFKTPVSQVQSPAAQATSPQAPESKIRNELVNALSSNHEKRREITTLRNEIDRLQRELSMKNQHNRNNDTDTAAVSNTGECLKCKELQSELHNERHTSEDEILKLRTELDETKSSNNELQTNMVELIKTMDKKKTQDAESHNNAMLKFVDDAKENLRVELGRVHEGEILTLKTEIDKLRSELMYTKEEYVKLCGEMERVEKQVKTDAQNDSKIEQDEMKFQLETEYKEKLKRQENELTNRYLEDLSSEREKWKVESELELRNEIEKNLMLAKSDWLKEYRSKKEEEVENALELAKVEWEQVTQAKSRDVDKLKETWEASKEVEFKEKLGTEKLKWHIARDKETEQKIKESKQLTINEENFKWKEKEEIIKKELDVQSRKEILALEATIEAQKQDLHKAEVTLQLKESAFLRKETDLKHSLKLLQSEVKELNEKLESVDSDSLQSRSSLIFKKIVDSKEGSETEMKAKLTTYENKEIKWQTREKELTGLLKETVDKLKRMKEENQCDCNVFRDSMMEKMETTSWLDHMSPNRKNKERQKSDEERLSTALELSRQKVASLFSSNEQLELDVEKLEKNIAALRESKELLKNELEKEFERERTIIEEKHKLEVEKILLIEVRKKEKMRREFQLEKDKLRNNIMQDITEQQMGDMNAKIMELKEKHVLDVKKLKQSFCDKLEKISRMKEKWLKEEGEKRKINEDSYQKEFEVKLSNVQSDHELEMEQQQKHWQALCEKTKAEYEMVINKLKTGHQTALKGSKQSLVSLEDSNRRLSKQLQSKEQDLKLVRNQYQQLMQKVKSLEEASIFDDQSQRSISPPTNHKSPAIKFNQSPAPPIASLLKTSKDGTNVDMSMIEELRNFYLQSVRNIQQDVESYTKSIRHKCDQEIREAVRRERKELIQKLNFKRRENSRSASDVVRRKSTKDYTDIGNGKVASHS
ncbi:golgin subfamily A member 6-like protein 22 [Clytia hemisphaerica]|uniref:CEP152 CEP63 binding coiled coil domain-containing protein n=1 Tax=Clytia hemisphaerica TaxID=252671 RepID=A0A7M5WVE0_9CNID